MKFWTALLILLFLTATLQAQIPYGGYNLQPYYPGAITQPYYPQAYYPQPYYMQEPYASSQLPVTEYSEDIDVLTRQVQQLSDEVRQLRAELASVQTLSQARLAEAPPATPPAPAAPPTPVVLVFKNGKRIESQGYIVAGQTLWVLTPSGSERIALSKLNVAATQKENLERGIQFPDLGSSTP